MTYQSHKAFDCFQYFPVRTRWLLVSEASRQLLQKRSKTEKENVSKPPDKRVKKRAASKCSGEVEAIWGSFWGELPSKLRFSVAIPLQQHHSFLVSKLVLLPVVQSQMGLPVGALSWKAPGQWWLHLLPQWLTSLVTKTPANIGNYCWTLTRSIWTKWWGVVLCIL